MPPHKFLQKIWNLNINLKSSNVKKSQKKSEDEFNNEFNNYLLENHKFN